MTTVEPPSAISHIRFHSVSGDHKLSSLFSTAATRFTDGIFSRREWLYTQSWIDVHWGYN
jgi:IS4 transposase